MRPVPVSPPYPRALRPAIGLILALAAAALAEDPLLGRIKVIQCVGCTPGSVDLIIHDPIDVRDFQVRINESDYQKIITPLAGKTVFEKEGCFYWMEKPKAPKTQKDKSGAAPARTGAKTDPSLPAASDAADSASAEPQGTPSRCIPYTRVEPKPSQPRKSED